jgi:hypothetical protein
MEGLGPQESPYYYDHPFFGQIFLAGIFTVLGFPNSVTGTEPLSMQSIDSLFLVPRLLMGGLAIMDTLLVYCIAKAKYGNAVALVAAVLFSVMPMTWMLRRVVLDSILVPFLLSSVLFAIYASNSAAGKKYAWILASGIALGLAIFVKVPIFVMIPLLCYLLLQRKNMEAVGRIRALALWFIPVLFIPALWPLEALASGNLDSWLDTVLWQAERGSRGIGILWISGIFMLQDPLFFSLAAIGGIYAAIKRNWFILLWELPYIAFLSAIGQPNYFHWNALLPAFSIASALALVQGMPRLLESIKMHNQKIVFSTVAAIFVAGLLTTSLVISTDVSLAQRQGLLYSIAILENENELYHQNDTTIIASPTYSWVLRYIQHHNNTLGEFRDVIFEPIKTQNWLLIADEHFRSEMMFEPKLRELYEQRNTLQLFNSYPLAGRDQMTYPETNLLMNVEGCDVEIAVKNTRQLDTGPDSPSDSAMGSRCNLALASLIDKYSIAQ